MAVNKNELQPREAHRKSNKNPFVAAAIALPLAFGALTGCSDLFVDPTPTASQSGGVDAVLGTQTPSQAAAGRRTPEAGTPTPALAPAKASPVVKNTVVPATVSPKPEGTPAKGKKATSFKPYKTGDVAPLGTNCIATGDGNYIDEDKTIVAHDSDETTGATNSTTKKGVKFEFPFGGNVTCINDDSKVAETQHKMALGMQRPGGGCEGTKGCTGGVAENVYPDHIEQGDITEEDQPAGAGADPKATGSPTSTGTPTAEAGKKSAIATGTATSTPSATAEAGKPAQGAEKSELEKMVDEINKRLGGTGVIVIIQNGNSNTNVNGEQGQKAEPTVTGTPTGIPTAEAGKKSATATGTATPTPSVTGTPTPTATPGMLTPTATGTGTAATNKGVGGTPTAVAGATPGREGLVCPAGNNPIAMEQGQVLSVNEHNYFVGDPTLIGNDGKPVFVADSEASSALIADFQGPMKVEADYRGTLVCVKGDQAAKQKAMEAEKRAKLASKNGCGDNQPCTRVDIIPESPDKIVIQDP
ncbi:MAG: hypothetical protein A2857_03820 [Candidatus Levybacteria bacterium RIFCSPHIGHO2_01_FULL_36_15]|nr:MAG: hypothetical protein A2857_03820 [Candidatus Levybacteria bacterium RIFCSPHIGHO2_01_FULL_36_15]